VALSADAARSEFDAFVQQASGSLLRVGYLMAGDLREAEDAVQETLMRTARRWPKVRKMDRPLAYARAILVNVILDGARGRSRRRAELGPGGPAPGDEHAERQDDGAERALRAVEARLDVAAALAALSPRQRAVVILRYWADLPETEVAAALGCSVGTVKSTASRSLARLRELMRGTPEAPVRTLKVLAGDEAVAGDIAHASGVAGGPRSDRRS
jgi:RNA polymerase sigma-70 factor (sigma-E family)